MRPVVELWFPLSSEVWAPSQSWSSQFTHVWFIRLPGSVLQTSNSCYVLCFDKTFPSACGQKKWNKHSAAWNQSESKDLMSLKLSQAILNRKKRESIHLCFKIFYYCFCLLWLFKLLECLPFFYDVCCLLLPANHDLTEVLNKGNQVSFTGNKQVVERFCWSCVDWSQDNPDFSDDRRCVYVPSNPGVCNLYDLKSCFWPFNH